METSGEITRNSENGSELSEWEQKIADFRFPRWNELPEIDLYMDQLVSYLFGKLSPLNDTGADTGFITATMINNYVKQKLIPPPDRKKYTRLHLSELFVLFCVKQVLSIEQSGNLIRLCAWNENPQGVYDRFCTIFETVLHHTVTKTDISDYRGMTFSQEDVMMITVAIAFSNRLYAGRLIADTTKKN